MSFFKLLILVLLGLGVWYVVQKLRELEVEIRRDIEARKLAGAEGDDDDDDDEPVRVESPAMRSETPAAPVPAEFPAAVEQAEPASMSLQERLLTLVGRSPGLMQAEIYRQFPEVNSRQLQQLLLRLDREGAIRREKEKGSYRVYQG